MSRHCKKCGQDKDTNEFTRHYGHVCSSCVNEISKKYYWEHRKEILKTAHDSRQTIKLLLSRQEKGIIYKRLAIPIYNWSKAVNEKFLIIEETKCKRCNKVLSMSEKLYGDYCVTHSRGQIPNKNNLAVMPKIL
jgi:hypothetical protein